MKRIYCTLVLLSACAWASAQQVQEVYRTFNYDQAAPSEAVVAALPQIGSALQSLQASKLEASKRANKVIQAFENKDKKSLKALKVKLTSQLPPEYYKTLEDTLIRPDEKQAIVNRLLGQDPAVLASAGKALADQGDLQATEAVVITMQEEHPDYAYTTLLEAYLAQKLGIQYCQKGLREQAIPEFRKAGMTISQLADGLTDSVPMKCQWTILAGELFLQGEDDVNARQQFKQALAMRPAYNDSVDIHLMDVYFDRQDAAKAVKDGDEVSALTHYEKALRSCREYLNSGAPLENDVYTSNVVEDYLYCLNNRANLSKRLYGRTDEYKEVITEVDRFLELRRQDISVHRYKLGAYFQICTNDTLSFPNYREAYRRSMDYITGQQFPATEYTYEDYNYAQQWATYAGDRPMRIEYLEKCIATYDDKGGQAGYVEQKQQLYGALVNSYDDNAAKKSEVLKAYNDYRLSVDSTFDVSEGDLRLAASYIDQLKLERDRVEKGEQVTLSAAEIHTLAQQSREIIDRYIQSPNENLSAAALKRLNDLTAAMLYLGADAQERGAYFQDYTQYLLQNIAECRQNAERRWEIGEYQQRLFPTIYSYINVRSARDGEFVENLQRGLQITMAEYAECPASEKEDFVKARIHTILSLLLEHNTSPRFMEGCRIMDETVLDAVVNAQTENLRELWQAEHCTFYRLAQSALNGNEGFDKVAFVRQTFLANMQHMYDAGMKIHYQNYIKGTSQYIHDVLSSAQDLTEPEQGCAALIFAAQYYDEWEKAHANMRAQKTMSGIHSGIAAASKPAAEGYRQALIAKKYLPKSNLPDLYLSEYNSWKVISLKGGQQIPYLRDVISQVSEGL